ncbi:C2 domain-containing protein 3 [Dryobates pubescens]|uniref:C2 domain-containing protein 3 n=1 Tax=Dryobates pubescens TaxID=118200 RepID=UPI0023B8A19F|nr:C2 domain-containing protein 3 [Dryobates pubescens]
MKQKRPGALGPAASRRRGGGQLLGRPSGWGGEGSWSGAEREERRGGRFGALSGGGALTPLGWSSAGSGEVPASTSLPPLVEGPLRCFLRCTVSGLLWTVARPPAAALVRLRWWGETSDGTVFQPAARPGQAAGRTSARYAVRCGSRQFAAYLTDMAVLVLEVLTRPDHLPVGKVHITGLSQLSPSTPISGCFSIVSPTAEKLGELQVSLALEPLPELYDTSSSIPTTDASLDPPPAQGRRKLQFLAPPQQPRPPPVTVGDPEFGDSSKATSPRRKDQQLLEETSPNLKDPLAAPPHHLILPEEPLELNPSEHHVSFSTSTDLEGSPRTNLGLLSLHNPATKDLLSAILEQGRKLRDAMAVSAMRSTPDMQLELHEVSPCTEGEGVKAPARGPKSFPSSFVPGAEDPKLLTSQVAGHPLDLSSEERAVELLLGSSDLSPVHLWDRTSSLLESLSLGSEVYESELNDPHYDQSLLESLFYSAPKSDSSLSDLLSDDDVNPSRKVPKREALQKAAPGIPQKGSDQHQKGTGIQSRPFAPPQDHAEEAAVRSLGADRLAVLQQIHLARVIIESLKIPPEGIQRSPRKKGLMGKPPRPATCTKCTFFVEFHFPVGASKDGRGQVSLSTELIQVASRKVMNDVVKFQQHFVLPVAFGGPLIDHWWSSELAFKLYMRKSTQKKPVAIGSAALQLQQVLKAELLRVTSEVAVQKEAGQPQVGPLKVSLELVADNKGLIPTTARSPAPAQPFPAHAIRSPQLEIQEPTRKSDTGGSPPGLNLPTWEDSQRTAASSTKPPWPAPSSAAQKVVAQLSSSEEEEGLLLHMLLMVPEGKDFVVEGSGLPGSCNVYLNCRLLSSEEATSSAVVWGTTQPAFDFSQVMPFPLTSKLLERLKNNILVLEAWNKVGSCDRLLGLVKLPLHQFYISFKDPKISQLLLQAQYPVVAVDSYMPVVDVFTGSRSGSLKVILAMGSAEQVVALQRLKAEEGKVPAVPQHPAHCLDPVPLQLTMVLVLNVDPEGEGVMVEHVFEIHVESMKGLSPLQSTVWGEADCYVQYHFPVQAPAAGPLQGADWPEDGIRLKPFRTAATLCVPDPIFHDQHHHSFLVPAALPVQKLLLRAFMAPGGTGGGVQFEVWCRYYYPNVRDQMVAKGTLPLSRLCAMVTKQHREEVGMQTFNLPLVPRTEPSEGFHLRPSGLLDVSVRYQRCMRPGAGTSQGQAVVLSVQIHRAAGLQAAARAVSQRNPALQCPAELGVSSYVCVQLPFLPQAGRRRTAAVPSTFCPEFQQQLHFPCSLISHRSGGEAASLGEILHSARIVFSIYQQSTKAAPGTLATQASRDYLLGTVTIPTRDLLRRTSGISGWFPVTLSEDVMPSSCMQAIVGGLELSVTFAHPEDRGRVLEAARLLGWSEESHEDTMGDSDEWEDNAQPVMVTISTPKLWLPLHCVLLAGQKSLDPDSCCYLRYKLYDQEATCTSLQRPKRSQDPKKVTVSFKKPKKVTLRRSPGLLWFFREEKLEVQVWWSCGRGGDGDRPLGTDRLLGSAYVDLSALAERSWTAQSVSGLYPLFRSGAADLAGAALRVHIILGSPRAAPPRGPPSAEEDGGGTGEEGTGSSAEGVPAAAPQHQTPGGGGRQLGGGGTAPGGDWVFLESTFAASVLVERAMHLSLKGSPLTDREVRAPSSCVSFPVAGADVPLSTSVVENTDSPLWDFQQQARLSKELLLDPQQTLVFKVWHKAESERVIGFASVDLSPLLSGFQLVCGWYNILDFSGQCRGQLKVAVSPLQNISHLKEERQARIRAQAAASSVKGSFPPLPTHAPSIPKQVENISKEVSVPPPEWQKGPAGPRRPRHQEHLRGVRSFHLSLQQAAGSTPRAARGGSLPPSPSRAALLTALRQNLSELDEVQSYFRQKLSRSFPHFTPPASGEEQESDPQGLGSQGTDPRGSHLLERSSQLVSQVSSLLNDLQTISKSSRESCAEPQEGSRGLGAPHLPQQEAEEAGGELSAAQLGVDSPQPPCLARSVFERHMLHELLAQAVPEGEDGSAQGDEGPLAAQPASDEEYEEDIIEPRALNEVTLLTDRSSPWSSLLSEGEPGGDHHLRPAGQPSGAACHRGTSSSTISSLLPGDPQAVLPTLSHHPAQGRPWVGAEGFKSEPLERGQPWGELPAAAAVTNASPMARGEEGHHEALHEGCEDEEDAELSVRSVSAQAGSEGNGESFSEESQGEALEESEKSSKPPGALSHPVVVPNFFLPPQEMEASMRLLSISAPPSTALTRGGGQKDCQDLLCSALQGGLTLGHQLLPSPCLSSRLPQGAAGGNCTSQALLILGVPLEALKAWWPTKRSWGTRAGPA